MAVTLMIDEVVAVELLAGAEIETDVGVTAVTVTTDEVTLVLLESKRRAVIEKLPAEVGTHVTENGAAVTVPTIVVPTRNWTWAIVVPATGVAEAVRTTLLPTFTIEPLLGAVMEIVGVAAAATVILTDAELTALPLESVTRAVRVVTPVAVGVQLTL